MKLATVSLALSLLIFPAFLTPQEKPAGPEKAGYDIGACSSDNFYVVHLNAVGDDFSLVLFMETPGEVQVLDKPVLYTYKNEAKDGRHYFSPAGTVELIFTFKDNYAVGIQKGDGEVHAMIYGMKGDGSEIMKNAETLALVCGDLRKDQGNKDKDSVPAPQTSEDKSYNIPSYFSRGGPIVKI